MILLVMQTLDNSMRLKSKRRLLGRGVGLTTEQDPENPKPDLHPRRRLGGSPRGREARRRGPGPAVPANPGVNPSLTITAMTAYAMSHIPTRAKAESGEDADGLAPAGVRDAGPAGARGGSANGDRPPAATTARVPARRKRPPAPSGHERRPEVCGARESAAVA